MKCPKCLSEHAYEDRDLWVCPECAHEWTAKEAETSASESQPKERIVKDVNGNILVDGDSVTVIRDLKVKGASSVVKVGTKVKRIRLIDAEDGHDISCNIEGFGPMNLKSSVVKKA